MPRKATFDAKIVSDYAGIHGEVSAMNYFGCSRATVRNACMRYGVTLPKQPRPTDTLHREIANYISQGNTIEEACTKYSLRPITIKEACRKNGVMLARKSNPPAFSTTTFEALRMILLGHEDSSIARELFITRERVRQIRLGAIAANLHGPEAIVVLKTNAEPCIVYSGNRSFYSVGLKD